MSTNSIKQELLREVYHDHHHFERMFADLKETFRLVATQELSLQERPDLVETANEDLHFLVEEMMDHIGVEEEAVFTILSDGYPQFNDRLHRFQDSHDLICKKLAEVRRALANDPADVESSALQIYNAVSAAHDIIEKHGREENSLFEEALEVMNTEDCERLLEALRES